MLYERIGLVRRPGREDAAAHEIGARIRMLGDSPQHAAETVVNDELKAMGGDGGVIFVGADGSLGWIFNTPGMFRGAVSSALPPVTAIFAD